MKKNFILFLHSILIASASIINAQSDYPVIISDRLGSTRSALTVPQDLFQIESGVSYQKQNQQEKNSNVEIENLSFGNTLFRYGINDNLELRFGGEFFIGKTTVDNVTTNIQGLQNIFVGSKFQLWKNNNIITNAGLIVEFGLPFGNENLRHDKIEPGIVLAIDKYVTDEFSACINLGAKNDSNLGKNDYNYSILANLGLSKLICMFAEFYSTVITDEIPLNSFNFGLKYLVRKNILVDCSVGTILSNSTSNWSGNFGISLRLPD